MSGTEPGCYTTAATKNCHTYREITVSYSARFCLHKSCCVAYVSTGKTPRTLTWTSSCRRPPSIYEDGAAEAVPKMKYYVVHCTEKLLAMHVMFSKKAMAEDNGKCEIKP
jgi:hypothetical protein